MTTPTEITQTSPPGTYGSAYKLRLTASQPNSSTEAVYGIWEASSGYIANQTIKVTFATNTWSDAGSSAPTHVVVVGANIELRNSANGTSFFTFAKPTVASWISSGPTVTSHTDSAIVTTSTDTSAIGSAFTFFKNGSSYSPSNLSLEASNTIGTNNDTGYIYDFNKTDTAMYTATIDSKSVDYFSYNDSWTSDVSGAAAGRNTTSTRILHVLGKIPTDTIMSWDGSTSLVKDTVSSDRYIRWYSSNGGATGTDRNQNFGLYVTGNSNDVVAIFFYYPEGFGSNITYSSPFSVGNQATMSYTAGNRTVTVQDWVYSDEVEGSNYTAPVSTASDGGGKRRRYPIISTNLFDRQRSIFSIGMTHKDETLF